MAVMSRLKLLNVAATADGDNTLVAAVTGVKIRVYTYHLGANAAGTAIIRSGTGGGTHATFYFAANGVHDFAGDYPRNYAFETAAGSALVINNSVGLDIGGHIAYAEV